MGGDLRRRPDGASPSFLVAALKDPLSGNLDRIQIIKGWMDEAGELHERIYDVAVSEWTFDRRRRALQGAGRQHGRRRARHVAEHDRRFRADHGVGRTPTSIRPSEPSTTPRVIEIPTPRWTAYEALRYGIDLPDEVPKTTQERAYTSPIWYTPR